MSATTPAPRILVIDDEPQIRRFLEISLRAQGYSVREAATAKAGLEELALRGADVVILDLGLPDRDGQDVLVDLRQWCTAPVIVLSVRADEGDKVRALDAGANDYVTKPFSTQELVARVRALLRAQSAAPDATPVFDDGSVRIDIALRRVTLHGEPVAMSRKEFAVLSDLVRHSGRVVTQQHLLRAHWGAAHLEDTHYLRIVVAKIRQKLRDDPARPRYVETESGVGYRFPASPGAAKDAGAA